MNALVSLGEEVRTDWLWLEYINGQAGDHSRQARNQTERCGKRLVIRFPGPNGRWASHGKTPAISELQVACFDTEFQRLLLASADRPRHVTASRRWARFSSNG